MRDCYILYIGTLGCDQRTQRLLKVSTFLDKNFFGFSTGNLKLVDLFRRNDEDILSFGNDKAVVTIRSISSLFANAISFVAFVGCLSKSPLRNTSSIFPFE
jgi:hypothetical protein